MNFLLEFSKEQFNQKNLDLSDVLSSGGMVVLTGMLTVFGVLALLWLTLVIFKFFFHDLSGKKVKSSKIVSEDAAPVLNAVPHSNDEIVAVIAAAVAMAESESPTGAKFRVVSFRRK